MEFDEEDAPHIDHMAIPEGPLPEPNRFLIVCLSTPQTPLEVTVGSKVSLGRRASPHLQNLHISREQVVIELKPDASGRTLICMTNRGKNSTRVLSVHRRKQARVASSTYCRLVPGDIIELLYDQQGQYAYKLIEATRDGQPMLRRTALVGSVTSYMPPDRYRNQQQVAHLSALLDKTAAAVAADGDADRDPEALSAVSAAMRGLASGSGGGSSGVPPAPDAPAPGSGGGGISAAAAASLSSLIPLVASLSDAPVGVEAQLQRSAWRRIVPEAALRSIDEAIALLPALLIELRNPEHTTPVPQLLVRSRTEQLRAMMLAPHARRLSDALRALSRAIAPVLHGPSAAPDAASDAPTAASRRMTRSGAGGGATTPPQPVRMTPQGALTDLLATSEAALATTQDLLRALRDSTAARRPGSVAGGDVSALSSSGLAAAPAPSPAPPGSRHSGAGHVSVAVVRESSSSRRESAGGRAGGVATAGGERVSRRSAAVAAGGGGGGGGNDALEEYDEDDNDAEDPDSGDDDDGGWGATGRADGAPGAVRGRRSSSLAQAGHASDDGAAASSHAPSRGLWDGLGLGDDPESKVEGKAESKGDEDDEPRRPESRLGRQPSAMSVVPFGDTGSPPSASGGSACSSGSGGGGASIFAWLPPHLIAPILSFLPLPSLLAASRVCSEWRAEVSRPGAIAVCDLGAYLQGISPPPPRLVANVSRTVGGRDVAVSGCLWLTTGALLTSLGVPIGVSAGPPLPAPTMALPPAASQAQREQAITGWLHSARAIASERRGGGQPSDDSYVGARPALCLDAPGEGGAPGSGAASPGRLFHHHSYLRAFLDEVSAAELAALLQASADEDAAEASSGASQSDSAARRSLLRSAFLPAGGDAASGGAWQPWWADIDSAADVITAAAAAIPAWAASAPGEPLDSPLPFSSPSAPHTTLREVAVSAVGAELVRQRASAQLIHALATLAPPSTVPGPVSPPHPAYGHAVSRAYSEMSIGLRCCIHRYAQAQRAFLADAAALADKAEVALLKALASAASPTSVAAAEAAIRAAVASADTTLAPPSILVSRRNPLASTCLIAAAASPTFLPVKDLLEHTARAARDAAREVDRSLEIREARIIDLAKRWAAGDVLEMPPEVTVAPLVSERGGVFDDHTEVSSADSCGDSTDEGGAAAAFAAAGVVHARRASRAGGSKAGGGAVSASNVVTARSTGVPELDAFAPSGGATVMEDVANLVRGVLQRLPGTEEATESVVAQALADTAARHALSATYAVAVGDLLEFPLQLSSDLDDAAGTHDDTDPAAVSAASAGKARLALVQSGAFDGELDDDDIRQIVAAIDAVATGGAPVPAAPVRSGAQFGSGALARPSALAACRDRAVALEVPFPAVPTSQPPLYSALAPILARAMPRTTCGTRVAPDVLSAALCGAQGGLPTLLHLREAMPAAPAPLPLIAGAAAVGLDLTCCTRLAPHNFPLLCRWCPDLAVLRAGGCSQLTSPLLVACAPYLRGLRQIDLDYSDAADDASLAALGRHCTGLTRVTLVGCMGVTDDGLRGLLPSGGGCTGLRRLNLRGCKGVGDEGVRHLANRCPQLREVCLSGLTAVTAPALAELLLRCPRIVRFKAELWYDGESNPPPHASSRTGGAAPALQPLPANAPENGRRSFRMLGSVRGTVRYLKSVLPASDPSIAALVARFPPEALLSSAQVAAAAVAAAAAEADRIAAAAAAATFGTFPSPGAPVAFADDGPMGSLSPPFLPPAAGDAAPLAAVDLGDDSDDGAAAAHGLPYAPSARASGQTSTLGAAAFETFMRPYGADPADTDAPRHAAAAAPGPGGVGAAPAAAAASGDGDGDILMSQLPDYDGLGPDSEAPWATPQRPPTHDSRHQHPEAQRNRERNEPQFALPPSSPSGGAAAGPGAGAQ